MNNKLKEQPSVVLIIILSILTIIAVLLPFGLIYGIIKIYNSSSMSLSFKVCAIITLSIILLTIIVIVLSEVIGTLRGKLVINKEEKKIIGNNPYIYYRELPNNYGIGVISLLFDSHIEKYKDIVAIILDLCARKYLSLVKMNDKFVIRVLKSTGDDLLSNEKYILDLIINNDIKNIDYKRWYELCLQDGMNLELYFRSDNIAKQENNDDILSSQEAKQIDKKRLMVSISIGAFIMLLGYSSGAFNDFLLSLAVGMVLTVIIYMLSIIPVTIGLVAKSSEKCHDLYYNNVLNSYLTRTTKGIDELHKLYSFKAFLNDFGAFVNKNPEEVVLWDRYLSYAQVFGLTRQIMQSGYKQLVDNASFKIDDIDNITFDNIEIEKNV